MQTSRQYGKIAKATTTVGLAILLSPSFTGVMNGWESIQMGKIARGASMSKVLINNAPHDNSVNLKYMNPRFVGDVVNSAEWSAQQLNLPYPFVISHWLMESGKLQMVKGFDSIEGNNFGGFRKRGRPMEFDSVDSFAKAYVNLLRKDGIHDVNNMDEIVKKLHNKHYVVGESEVVYEMKIIHTMDELSKADPAIKSYYTQQIGRRDRAVATSKISAHLTHAKLRMHLRK